MQVYWKIPSHAKIPSHLHVNYPFFQKMLTAEYIAEGTELRERMVIQRVLLPCRPGEMADWNLMGFNKGNCQVLLHVGKNNLRKVNKGTSLRAGN